MSSVIPPCLSLVCGTENILVPSLFMEGINNTLTKNKVLRNSGCRKMMIISSLNMGIRSEEASEERGNTMGHNQSCAWIQSIKY